MKVFRHKNGQLYTLEWIAYDSPKAFRSWLKATPFLHKQLIHNPKIQHFAHVADAIEVGADMYREMVEDRMARLARKKTNNA